MPNTFCFYLIYCDGDRSQIENYRFVLGQTEDPNLSENEQVIEEVEYETIPSLLDKLDTIWFDDEHNPKRFLFNLSLLKQFCIDINHIEELGTYPVKPFDHFIWSTNNFFECYNEVKDFLLFILDYATKETYNEQLDAFGIPVELKKLWNND